VTTSQISQILDDIADVLAPLGRVVRVSTWRPAVIDGDLPAFLIRPLQRESIRQDASPNRPTISKLRVAILAVDGGRSPGDESWGALRAEELEAEVVEAVNSDSTRSGLAGDTNHISTTYSPEIGSVQIDASVVIEFDILHRVRHADLTSNLP
jgi:hypothetical protein